MRLLITILLFLMMPGCRVYERPLCRHIVLSQYTTFVDAGYEVEIWHMENEDPKASGGFKYHVACRVRKPGSVTNSWKWVEQGPIAFIVTDKQPQRTRLLRKVGFDEVSKWRK